MPRAVSTREAKDKLSSLIGWVSENADEVIVENHGQPRAVIMSFAEYEKIRAVKEQQRRHEALRTLRRLRSEVRERNQDLTEEQAEEIAERVSRDVMNGLMDKGKVRFEQ